MVDIELQTLEQFDLLLQRANQLLLSGEVQQQGEAAVVFVLHGPVLRSLLKQNYLGKPSNCGSGSPPVSAGSYRPESLPHLDGWQ